MRLPTCAALLLALNFAAATAIAKPPTDSAMATYATQLMQANYPSDGPGAVALVVRGDKVIFRGARGMASVQLNVPLNPEQVLRIGSVTKQFAAAALLKLVDDGKVSLDDTLEKYLPDYPNAKAITIMQLLNHTAGVKSYTDIADIMNGPIRRDVSTAELIDTFKDKPIDFVPGADWAYNNSGYVLVGAVIEAVSGMSWDAYLSSALLVPAGLKHTQYGADDRVIAGMVQGYSKAAETVVPAAFLSMTQPHAAGALVSSVDDLHRWNRALHGGTLLKAASYRAMITPIGKAVDHDYGFGIGVSSLRGTPMLSHGGGIFGFSSHLLYLPDEPLSVVVLQNSDSSRDAAVIAIKLGAYALGKPFPEAKAIDVDDVMLASYVGVYRVDEKNVRELRLIDGVLSSQRTGGPVYKLMPVAADQFLFEDGITYYQFERTNGQISGTRLFANGSDEGEYAAHTDEALSAQRVAITPTPERLAQIVGDYLGGPGALRIFMDGDTLKAQLASQPAFDLFAETNDLYFLTVFDATLEFAPSATTATGLTLRQRGADISFTREGKTASKAGSVLDKRVAINADPARLRQIVGDYVGAPGALRIFMDGEKLKAQLDGQPAFDLFAETADHYFLTVVDATLEFSPSDAPTQSLTLRQNGASIKFARKE